MTLKSEDSLIMILIASFRLLEARSLHGSPLSIDFLTAPKIVKGATIKFPFPTRVRYDSSPNRVAQQSRKPVSHSVPGMDIPDTPKVIHFVVVTNRSTCTRP